MSGHAASPVHRRLAARTIALDHTQGLRIGRGETIDHSMRPEIDPHGVDDQRIAFAITHRISVHRWDQGCGLKPAQPHYPELAVVPVDEGDPAGLLQQLDIEAPKI